jgi:21S rRNA (uridine2791-2'-O)-methyltransferase
MPEERSRGYIELEKHATLCSMEAQNEQTQPVGMVQMNKRNMSLRQRDEAQGRVVDVVLSDMCEPWEQTEGFGKRIISDVYYRMMNTSGMSFRDHAGSMVSPPHFIMLLSLGLL